MRCNVGFNNLMDTRAKLYTQAMMSRRTIRIVALVLAFVAGVSGALGYNVVDDNNIRYQSREHALGEPFDCRLDL
jgi:hypothetical protein